MQTERPIIRRSITLTPDRDGLPLIAYVPDLVKDVVMPLQNHGVANTAIRDLGGRSELNPLNELVGN